MKIKSDYLTNQAEELSKLLVQISNFQDRLLISENCDDYDSVYESMMQAFGRIRQSPVIRPEANVKLYGLRIEAYQKMGLFFIKKKDYDRALTYLETAKRLTERALLESWFTEIYVRTCMGIGTCYQEKHGSRADNNRYYKLAYDILKGREQEFPFLALELYISWASFNLDASLQRETEEDEDVSLTPWACLEHAETILFNITTLPDSFPRNPTASKPLTSGIRDIIPDRELAQKLVQLRGRLSTDSNACADNFRSRHDAQDSAWLVLQIDTYLSTKGYYYKDDYFKQRDNRTDISQSMKKSFSGAYYFFMKGYEADPKNTFDMDNLALLLHDFIQISDRELLDSIQDFEPDFTGRTLSESLAKADEKLRNLIQKVLDVEFNNMMALNLKERYSPVLERPAALNAGNAWALSNYPAMQYSSLKNHLQHMGDIWRDFTYTLPLSGQTGIPEPLKDIMLLLTRLHNNVSAFMNTAALNPQEAESSQFTVGHYTRLSVLPKLINRQGQSKFRLYNVQHLNDPQEGALLLNLLENRMLMNPLIKDILSKYRQDSSFTKSSVYMGSFTSRLDRLNMWYQYGDNGNGCSLQINPLSFDRLSLVSMPKLDSTETYTSYKLLNTKYPLYTVLYLPEQDIFSSSEILDSYTDMLKGHASVDEDESSWWKRQAELAEALYKFIADLSPIITKLNYIFCHPEDALFKESLQTSDGKRLREEVCDTVMALLDLVRFLIKSQSYVDEREYRVIQYANDPECDTTTEVPKLYVEMEKPLSYTQVRLGPLISNPESVAAYPLNIKKPTDDVYRKESWGIKVCRSSIKIR